MKTAVERLQLKFTRYRFTEAEKERLLRLAREADAEAARKRRERKEGR